MTNPTTTHDEIKQLAKTMETLAREVHTKLDNNDDGILVLANELIRNSSTFTFVLGEMYALTRVGTTKTVTAAKVSVGTTVKRPTGNYHTFRDTTTGRFARRV